MKFYQRFTYILVICTFSLILSIQDGYSEIRVVHTDRAAVGQEIYNWIDIDNEPVISMSYKVDGVWQAPKAPASNVRWMYHHLYGASGTHSFELYITLSTGEVRSYTWTTTMYNPTRDVRGAVWYAENYALTPNNENYHYFRADDGSGEDCTNFVSQILGDSEGGDFPQALSWHYWFNSYPLGFTSSWVNVGDFNDYLVSSGMADWYSPEGWGIIIGGEKTYMYPPLMSAKTLKYQWKDGGKHNAFIVGRFGADQPVVDYHSFDSKHKDWRLIEEQGYKWVYTKVTQYRTKWDY